MIDSTLLVNELQTGDRLVSALHQHKRSDFGLLLAMMSQNVLDHAVFNLPQDSQPYNGKSEDKLRQELGLQPTPSFAAQTTSSTQSVSLNLLLNQANLASVKLATYLQPEPLAAQDNKHHIDAQVVSNCEPVVQHRLLSTHRLTQPLAANETALYDILEQLH